MYIIITVMDKDVEVNDDEITKYYLIYYVNETKTQNVFNNSHTEFYYYLNYYIMYALLILVIELARLSYLHYIVICFQKQIIYY